MKVIIFAALLVVAVSASFVEEHAAKFQEFKLKHGKTYSNQVEEARRYAIFRDNLRSIEEHNALYELGQVSYKKGINQFTDMTADEFRARLTLHKRPVFNNTIKYVKKGVAVPDSVDWRSTQVTDVKNQGNCGSCWAFSVTGSTEAAYYRKHNQLQSLSEQQLVDCSTDINEGCNGGYLDETFPYVQEKGLQSESSYPYTGVDAKCNYDASKVVTKVDSYVSLQEDEAGLLEAVATVGPVSVAIDASYLSAYEGGVYEDIFCSADELNHGVLVVGYGTQDGKDYWIVKNSWGASWGEEGYFKLLRGKNECGVTEDDVYPIIN